MRDCAGGSDAVKAAGTKYLPCLDGASTSAYEAYKCRALYLNAPGRTIDVLAGALFQRSPEINTDDAIKRDATLTGVPLEQFALQVAREVLTVGRHGVLVDMTAPEATEQRPYLVPFRAEDIVNWRVRIQGGDAVLTRVVLRQTAEQPDPEDEFSTKCVEQYRVLQLTDAGYTQTVFKQVDNAGRKEWIADTPIAITRRGAALTRIPFLFIGADLNTPDVAAPPMLDLADVALSLYRSSADLEHGRFHVSLPTPVVIGAQSNGVELTLGAGSSINLPMGGDAKFLEFTGAGLGSLENAIKEKRELLGGMGARMFDPILSRETATAITTRHSGDHASLRVVASNVESGLTAALQWAAWWVGTEQKPEDAKAAIAINRDFVIVDASPQEVQGWLQMFQAGAISGETFYFLLARGGQVRKGVTYAQERKQIEKEGGAVVESEPDPDEGADDSE